MDWMATRKVGFGSLQANKTCRRRSGAMQLKCSHAGMPARRNHASSKLLTAGFGQWEALK